MFIHGCSIAYLYFCLSVYLFIEIFPESFSREVLSQQWDRIRIICRQPFRKDKQFGLSFIRIAAKDDEALPPTGSTVRSSDSNEGSKDGVMRLIKKASGFTDDTTRYIHHGKHDSHPGF